MTNKLQTLACFILTTLAACAKQEPPPVEATCAQYISEACDVNDHDCADAIMQDCAPPVCHPSPGKHC